MGILSILVSRVNPHSEALPRAGVRSRRNLRANPERSLLVSLSQHHTKSQCLAISTLSQLITLAIGRFKHVGSHPGGGDPE
jgi:hypothetical protein